MDEVFKALCEGNREIWAKLGVDDEAFEDVSNLIRHARHNELALELVRDLWKVFCSPPPCTIPIEKCADVVELLEKALKVERLK